MIINVCIGEKPGGLVDLIISPEISNYPIDYFNMNTKPYRIESLDLPKDMVGEMIQKYIDKGGVV